MSEHTRSRAGIECIKFLSKFYEDDLIVLRNYSEIIDGSFRDIDLFLDVKNYRIIFDFWMPLQGATAAVRPLLCAKGFDV